MSVALRTSRALDENPLYKRRQVGDLLISNGKAHAPIYYDLLWTNWATSRKTSYTVDALFQFIDA